MRIDYDICLCGNAEKCPNKDICERGRKHGPGIYTISNFYDEKNIECDYFIFTNKEVDKNVKR